MTVFKPKGVCSSEMKVSIKDGKIEEIVIVDGCSGNSRGIMSLLTGMDPQEAIEKLRGIQCRSKKTSCPDQLSYAIEKALEEETAAQ